MEQIVAFFTSLEAIVSVVSAAVGGIGLRLWDTHLRSEKQGASLSESMRDELRGMLSDERAERKALDKRVSGLEKKVEKERERRLEAERQNELLQQKLNLVIRLLNEMRSEQGLERLQSDELAMLALNKDGE